MVAVLLVQVRVLLQVVLETVCATLRKGRRLLVLCYHVVRMKATTTKTTILVLLLVFRYCTPADITALTPPFPSYGFW